jgi:tetraacyldisaccharide 4'-kinase
MFGRHMDHRAIEDILSGRRKGIGPSLLRGGLAPAGGLYGLATRSRRGLYRAGLLRSQSAEVPVISVGNLTTGGTGKTPMVAWIVAQLRRDGANPAVLIRGYKARCGTSDEAELLGRLTECHVIVNPDRIAGARAAVSRGADVLVMDDGFQHLRLARDLNVVLIDATRPFGYGHCLPRGLLREPLGALTDADVIVITRSDAVEGERLERLGERLGRLAPQASLCTAIHKPLNLIDDSGRSRPLDSLGDRRVFAFCGIANPGAFFRRLAGLGMQPAGQEALDDHAHYTPDRIENLCRSAKERGADTMITTQKDFVKLAAIRSSLPVWQLAVEMEVLDGKEEFLDNLHKLHRVGRRQSEDG